MSEGKLVDVNTMYGVTSLSELTRDEGAIINQIINTILIPKRTSKFRPQRGSSLHDYLGAPLSPVTAVAIRDSLHKDLVRAVRHAQIRVTDIQVNLSDRIIGYYLRIAYTSLLNGSSNTVSIDLPSS